MTVLGLSGTPRCGGNTEYLLSAALEPFAEAGWNVYKILLSEKDIAYCTGCECCESEESLSIFRCVIQTDAMPEIIAAFEACDAIVIAAPVYWRNVPAQLKAVFDRTYGAKNKPLRGKPGGAIAVGRGTGGGQAVVLNVIHNFLLSSGALCVPGELNGVTAAADRPGDILAQPRRLEQARILGRNIWECCKNRNIFLSQCRA
jgi:multimeric flavodoxin WrbA